MRRALSGTQTLWGAEWCQVGLDLSTTACPTLLPPSFPHLYPLHTSPAPLSPLLLCSVGVTPLVAPQWHHRYLFMGEWWEGETGGMVGRSSNGGFCNQCTYIMGVRCHCDRHPWVSVTKWYRWHYEIFLNNVAMGMWEHIGCTEFKK